VEGEGQAGNRQNGLNSGEECGEHREEIDGSGV
jgi:hypothetical protein